MCGCTAEAGLLVFVIQQQPGRWYGRYSLCDTQVVIHRFRVCFDMRSSVYICVCVCMRNRRWRRSFASCVQFAALTE